MEEHHVAKV